MSSTTLSLLASSSSEKKFSGGGVKVRGSRTYSLLRGGRSNCESSSSSDGFGVMMPFGRIADNLRFSSFCFKFCNDRKEGRQSVRYLFYVIKYAVVILVQLDSI